MKRVHIIFFALGMGLAGWLLLRVVGQESLDLSNQDSRALWEDVRIEEKIIEGKKLQLLVASTDNEREQGLMYVRKPAHGFDGMIFYFDTPAVYTFWNQDTFVDLTLYWLNGEEVVGKSDLPSIESSGSVVRVRAPQSVTAVVEVIQ